MRKFVIILACGLMSGSFVFAQTTTPKIGWIESAELLQSMPEKSKADSDLAKYAKDFQSQIEIMMKEYQSKGQLYQTGEKSMTEAMREVKAKEIQDLQARIEGTQQSAQEKLRQKKEDVYQPILDKADKAIKAVAKEKNYDYILDKSGGSLLYGKDGDNILPFVKARLGIK
jgi:outer membrane protein